jgi:hypothetical protein
MTDITTPQDAWTAPWKKPETEVEALEVCLDIARDELTWCSGSLFEPKKGADLSKGPVCTNVQACAVGIVIMATMDGPEVKKYLDYGGNFHGNEEESIRSNPVATAAVIRLARTVVGNDGYAMTLDKAIRTVEHENDDSREFEVSYYHNKLDRWIDRYDRKRHHKKIVKLFERALEMARKDAT